MEHSTYDPLSPLKIREVYTSLQDDISRVVFNARLLYYLSGDKKHMDNMLNKLNDMGRIGNSKTIMDFLHDKSLHEKKIILYGAGCIGCIVFQMLKEKGIQVFAYCDSNKDKQGNQFMGLRIISTEELLSENEDAEILISTATYSNEILNQLKRMGVQAERVYTAGSFSEEYFGENLIPAVENEVYIDVGVWDGHSISRFLNFCGYKYKKIYGLEPDPANWEKSEKWIKQNNVSNVTLVQKGAWSCNTSLAFDEDKLYGGEGSRISQNGDLQVEVTTIDELVGHEIITLIKMDIEGAELEALKGAENTIKKNKPRLMICVYHKAEDILTIPLYLKSLVPEYRFFIRHHGLGYPYVGTVLYAAV